MFLYFLSHGFLFWLPPFCLNIESCILGILQDTHTSRGTEGAAGFAKRRTLRPRRHAESDPAKGQGLGLHAPRYSLSRGVTMDSVPRDLRDALAEDLDPEADRASAANTSSARITNCLKCKSLPAPGSKLRYCGHCETAAYCSKPCARADWATHKLKCESLRQSHRKALAAFVAQGGRPKDFNQSSDDFRSWFLKVPGLTTEIELMAWTHRSQEPIICASAFDADVDGSTIRVAMIPRSFWDEDPRFLDTFSTADREGIRLMFGEASFSTSTKYLCMLNAERQGKPRQAHITTFTFQADGPIRDVKIVEALTAATRPEDLADAFAWFESMLQAQDAHEQLQFIRHRARSLHGCTAPQGSVPVPTRALNTEVAYMVMNALDLAFDIRLTGLRSATHLNGREGVIRGLNSADTERWTARLNDGTCVSVKAANIVHVRRGDYRRVSP